MDNTGVTVGNSTILGDDGFANATFVPADMAMWDRSRTTLLLIFSGCFVTVCCCYVLMCQWIVRQGDEWEGTWFCRSDPYGCLDPYTCYSAVFVRMHCRGEGGDDLSDLADEETSHHAGGGVSTTAPASQRTASTLGVGQSVRASNNGEGPGAQYRPSRERTAYSDVHGGYGHGVRLDMDVDDEGDGGYAIGERYPPLANALVAPEDPHRQEGASETPVAGHLGGGASEVRGAYVDCDVDLDVDYGHPNDASGPSCSDRAAVDVTSACDADATYTQTSLRTSPRQPQNPLPERAVPQHQSPHNRGHYSFSPTQPRSSVGFNDAPSLSGHPLQPQGTTGTTGTATSSSPVTPVAPGGGGGVCGGSAVSASGRQASPRSSASLSLGHRAQSPSDRAALDVTTELPTSDLVRTEVDTEMPDG